MIPQDALATDNRNPGNFQSKMVAEEDLELTSSKREQIYTGQLSAQEKIDHAEKSRRARGMVRKGTPA